MVNTSTDLEKKSTRKKTSRKKTVAKASSKKTIEVKERPSRKRVVAISNEERLSMIAIAAYKMSENRSFAPGHELSDWLFAEKEVDDMLEKKLK